MSASTKPYGALLPVCHWMVISFIGVRLLASMSSESRAQDRSDLLTWRETVGSVFVKEKPRSFLKRANPQAREAIWLILESESLRSHHESAVQYLAFLGREEDVKRLRELAKSGLREYLHTHKSGALQGLGIAVGLMARREVPGARELIRKMTQRSYWRELAKAAKIREAQLDERTIDKLIYYAFYGLALSGEEELEKYASDITKEVSDPQQKKNLEFYCNPQANRQSATAFVAGFEDPIPESMLQAVRQQLAGTQDNPRSRTLRDFVIDSKYLMFPKGHQSRRMGGIVTGKNITETMPARDRDRLAKEAVEVYRRITTELLDEQRTGKEWVERVLFMGGWKGDSRGTRYEDLPYFPKMMAETRAVLKQLKQRDPQPADFEIWQDTVQVNRQIDEWPGRKGQAVEVVTVMFRLKGTEKVQAEIGSDHLTRNEDGNLVVLLKKVDDKWYWNPFGW